MKTLLSIIFCIILNNLCHSQVDYSTDWVNTGWKYSNEEDSIIDVTQKVIHTNDLSYLLKSTYPSYNEQKGMLPLYGLVGENFNKIEILFTEIKKSS